MTTTQTATSARTAAEGLILEENHYLPLFRLQLTLRVGATSDQTASGTAASGCPPAIGLCNFASELRRRCAGGGSRTATICCPSCVVMPRRRPRNDRSLFLPSRSRQGPHRS